MFLDMLGYLRFSPPVLWEPAHQLNELLGGGSRLGLRQYRAQLRHHSSCTVISTLAPASFRIWRTNSGNLLRASLIESFMVMKCTRVYKFESTGASEQF